MDNNEIIIRRHLLNSEDGVGSRQTADRRDTIVDAFVDSGLQPTTTSAPVDGRISVWTNTGRRTWETGHVDALDDALGRRTLPFASTVEQAQPAVTMLPPAGDKLIIVIPEEQYSNISWQATTGLGATVIHVPGHFVDDQVVAATDRQWARFSWWLTGPSEQAACRGDMLIVESGQTTTGLVPCVSAVVGCDAVATITTLPETTPVDDQAVACRIELSRNAFVNVGHSIAQTVRDRAVSPLLTRLITVPGEGTPATFL